LDERIAQAAQGNAEALAALLYEHHDDLQRFVGQRIPPALRPMIEPDDLLQMVFVDAFRGIEGFRPKSDRAFYRWLEVIAENRLTDTIRSQAAKKRGGDLQRVGNAPRNSRSAARALLDDLTGGVATPSRQVARGEGIAAMQARIAMLPDDYREAIVLRHLEGLSREEVAKRMGRTVAEVRGLLYRARVKLREAMGNESDFFTKK